MKPDKFGVVYGAITGLIFGSKAGVFRREGNVLKFFFGIPEKDPLSYCPRCIFSGMTMLELKEAIGALKVAFGVDRVIFHVIGDFSEPFDVRDEWLNEKWHEAPYPSYCSDLPRIEGLDWEIERVIN